MSDNKKTTWKIDTAHSEINFKVKHMMISTVTGSFEKFDGKIETSEDDFKDAHFTFYAEIDSINTNNKDRDTHLKSDDFFGAENNPELTFKSKSFDGEKIVGTITIKGVSQEITMDANYNGTAVDPYGQTKAGFEFEGSLNRKDFGLTWSAVTEAGNVVVSDKVKLIASLQYIKQ
ncbi:MULTISPECIES: YceI family protein [Aequorivita]|uniref:YceI family protein n=1 Tax=Aequorivita iocasae TaxID=2803865 RepID=A0ABX7DS15_9FLAO|nr:MULTISPECIES: YceI family protein [Aequorivita]QQX76262.1 YceI family protein [Aequorivita iocasae]UCA55725.1 YceI family protein [Aequorivita sp. F7]